MFELPFRGRAESFQLLGVGRLSIASQLCAERKLSPVGFGEEQALFQLSIMRWKQCPVGPYCASFAGPVVTSSDAASTFTASRAATSGHALLSAFLRAPKALFVPVYTISDSPASRAFGHQVLGIHKTDARFNLKRTGELTHLQVMEERRTERGEARVSGFSFSVSAGPRAAVRAALSPNLLLSRELYCETAKSWWRGGVRGVMHMPAHGRESDTVPIGTHFVTRPRLLDLATDARASFTPLVLDRPAFPNGLGALLEAAEFTPRILMWDPDLRGSILGRLDRGAT